MEKIIINHLLYNCKNGTNAKIAELLHKGDKALAMEHEKGTSHVEYDAFLWNIIDNNKGIYIENAYRTT